MVNEVRNQLHLIKTEDLTGTQIKSAAGELFLSENEVSNQIDTNSIVEVTRSVKVPFYGAAIPNTSKIASKTGDSGLMSIIDPVVNKTYQILAIDAVNAGAGNITVALGYSNGGDFVRINTITVAATSFGSFTTRNAYTFDSSVYPAFLVTSGAAGDLVVNMAYCEVIQ
jgi:hypothetical protein